MAVWKNTPFKNDKCWYTLEDWHGTYKSPISRKENDLKQTSITMFHVNIQGCIYVRFLECSRMRNFIKLRDSHGNPNGESKLKPPKTATRWRRFKAPGYLTSWWLNQPICKNLRFSNWIIHPLKNSGFLRYSFFEVSPGWVLNCQDSRDPISRWYRRKNDQP